MERTLEVCYKNLDGSVSVKYQRPEFSKDANDLIRQVHEMIEKQGNECRYFYRYIGTETMIEDCPEFPHFGAKYPDARCCDGFLWDLDSYEDGFLTKGGDDPCPFCNTEAFMEWAGVDPEDDEAPTREDILERIKNTRARYGR